MANINNKIQIGSEVVASLDSKEVMYDAEISVHDKIDEVNNSLTEKIDDYLPLAGGNMTGKLVAIADTNYSNYQVRNIKANTSSLKAGTTALSNGCIHLTYS